MNSFNPTGYGTSHQVTMVRQNDGTPQLGDTILQYDARGNRISDDNTSTLTNDARTYSYDGRSNVINVHGKYFTGGVWHDYDVASAFDAKNRRVMKSFTDASTGVQAQSFFYYDADDRLTEVRYTPNVASPSTFTIFQFMWLDDRLVLYWQTDFPSVTTSRRYVGTDEMERPIDMWSWPASGNATRVWAINPSAWGFDTLVTGASVYQPFLFAGQHVDAETLALQNSGTTPHRPALALNGFRTYDANLGGYLRVDDFVDDTWSSYGYADSNPVGKLDPTGQVVCQHAGECGSSADTSMSDCDIVIEHGRPMFACKSIWEGTLADCDGWSPGPGCSQDTDDDGGGGGDDGEGGTGTNPPVGECSHLEALVAQVCGSCITILQRDDNTTGSMALGPARMAKFEDWEPSPPTIGYCITGPYCSCTKSCTSRQVCDLCVDCARRCDAAREELDACKTLGF